MHPDLGAGAPCRADLVDSHSRIRDCSLGSSNARSQSLSGRSTTSGQRGLSRRLVWLAHGWGRSAAPRPRLGDDVDPHQAADDAVADAEGEGVASVESALREQDY